jgi:hypothetical protein
MTNLLKNLTQDLGVAAILILSILITVAKDWLLKLVKDPKRIFEYKTKNNIKIKDLCSEARAWMHANRATIWEFWNTKETMSGFPMQFTGITCESTDKATKEIYQYLKEESTSNYTEKIKRLLSSDVRYTIYHDDDNEEDLPEEVRSMMNEYMIKSTIIFKLHSDHLMYGTLSVHFQNDYYSNEEVEYRPKEITQKEYDKLHTICTEILKLKKKPTLWDSMKTIKIK